MEEEQFEWLCAYKDMKPMLNELIPDKSQSILLVGIGNSTFGVEMWEDGYHNMINTDYSPVVIANMSAKYPEVPFEVADMTNLGAVYGDRKFDVVLDKAAMDALVVRGFELVDVC